MRELWVATNFPAPFSQAKALGQVWSEGLFLGLPAVHEETRNIPAWRLWSEERVSIKVSKQPQCLCV